MKEFKRGAQSLHDGAEKAQMEAGLRAYLDIVDRYYYWLDIESMGSRDGWRNVGLSLYSRIARLMKLDCAQAVENNVIREIDGVRYRMRRALKSSFRNV